MRLINSWSSFYILKIKDHSITYLTQVKMEGKLAKGQAFTMSVKNQESFNNQPTQEYIFKYKLLQDFKRKLKVKVKCISQAKDFTNMGNSIGISADDFFKISHVMVSQVQYFSEIWRESDEAKIYVNGRYSFAVGGNQTVDGCYLTTACVQHRGLGTRH